MSEILPSILKRHLYIHDLKPLKSSLDFLKSKIIQKPQFPPTLLANFWNLTITKLVSDGKWQYLGLAPLWKTFWFSEHSEQWTYLRTPQWNCEVLYHWRKNVEFEISSFSECDRLLRFVSVFNRYSLLLVKIQPKFLLKLCRGVMMIFFWSDMQCLDGIFWPHLQAHANAEKHMNDIIFKRSFLFTSQK